MPNIKLPAIYIITNKKYGVLYTGVTSNLIQRIFQHKNKIITGFSSKYNCTNLVYYEICDNMNLAIMREKQIKSWSRIKKVKMINDFNCTWRDLYEDIL